MELHDPFHCLPFFWSGTRVKAMFIFSRAEQCDNCGGSLRPTASLHG
jgi:hypothetical protein